jgi:hypothetical protein
MAAAPWDLAPHLPWQVFTSPAAKWAVQPTFVLGEYLFYACAVLALAHAWRQGDERRRHLAVWLGALIAGTANDMFFMALPLVDNFWQAQATIMLTPRLPLYIPCVYVCFMYYPVVSAWRLRLSPLGRAGLSGLAGSLFYAPYDITGAKFLWWTWHDSDLPIAHRLLGAPIGSTMWVLTFVAAFAWLIGRVLDRDPAVARKTFLKAIATVAAFTTLLMMVQITALQQIDGGVPGPVGLCVVILLYGGLALAARRRARPEPPRPADRLLQLAVVVYFAAFPLLMAAFDPATHRSASVHQTYGPCHVEATDITGLTRYQYVCAEDYDEDYTFDCAPRPADGSEWYTVCGRPHARFARWLGGVAGLGAIGILLYASLLGAFRRRAT